MTEIEAEYWVKRLEDRAKIRLKYKPNYLYQEGKIFNFLVSNKEYLIAGSYNGKLMIWKRSNEKLYKQVSLTESPECGILCDDILIVAGSSLIYVYLVDDK